MEAGQDADAINPEYRVYKRRWFIMLAMMLCNMLGYMLNVSFAPVAPTAAEYYQVSGDMIDLFPLVGLGVNVPGLLLALFFMERYGIKVGMRLGSTCLMCGAIVRGLSTFPAYEDKIDPKTKFWLTFSGQIVIALGHPFLMTVCTKVSQAWFAEKERLISTAAMSGSGALGGMIGSVISPIIVRDDPSNIPILNAVLPTFSIVGFIVTWLSVTMDQPPLPPSPSASKKKEVSTTVTFQAFITNVKPVIKNPSVIAIIIVMGIGIGVFNMLASQLGQLMCPLGYNEGQAGLATALLILAGLVGAFVVGPIARRYRKNLEFTKFFMPLSALSGIALVISLRYDRAYPAIVLSLMGFGFCGLGSFPLVLELGVEESFPSDPVISEAFVHASGQLVGLIMILLGNVMHWKPNSRILDAQVCSEEEGLIEPWDYTPFYYLIECGAFLLAVSHIVFVNPTMRRSMLDRDESK